MVFGGYSELLVKSLKKKPVLEPLKCKELRCTEVGRPKNDVWKNGKKREGKPKIEQKNSRF